MLLIPWRQRTKVNMSLVTLTPMVSSSKPRTKMLTSNRTVKTILMSLCSSMTCISKREIWIQFQALPPPWWRLRSRRQDMRLRLHLDTRRKSPLKEELMKSTHQTLEAHLALHILLPCTPSIPPRIRLAAHQARKMCLCRIPCQMNSSPQHERGRQLRIHMSKTRTLRINMYIQRQWQASQERGRIGDNEQPLTIQSRHLTPHTNIPPLH